MHEAHLRVKKSHTKVKQLQTTSKQNTKKDRAAVKHA
jgi:hypothetical protein